MPKIQTDYCNTIIYKLCCKDPEITDIYIGHTTNFTKRKNQHKTCCINENDKQYNRYVYQFIRDNGGWENWTMIQVESTNCKDKREAESIEQYWIEQTAASLNSIKPFTLHKEEPQLYKHIWYEEKKDYILEKAKNHYEENKEQIKAYNIQYAQENKEKISEYQKDYRESNREKLSEQKKIYREEHKDEAKIKQKEWREANKEKLKAKKSEVINCECGHQYTFGNKHRHLQSKIHIQYQDPKPVISEEEKDILEENNKKLEEEKILKTKQQQKIYREENSEKINNYKKQQYQQNKEQILEQNKKYKEEHKKEISNQQKVYVEENKEKIKETKSVWYQKNKEKILQKSKEMIMCECGCEIRKSGRVEHCRSKKHNDYIQSLVN